MGVGAIVDIIVGRMVGDGATVGVILFCARRVGAADGTTDGSCVGNTAVLGTAVTVAFPPDA